MSLKRSIAFLAGIVCILLVSCDNIFYSIASSGEKKPNINEYTVTFDKNYGDTEASPQTMTIILPASTVGVLPQIEPTRADFVFTGWNTNRDGSGAEFTVSTPVKADITVYAQWLYLPPGSFIVHFDKKATEAGSEEAHPQNKAVIPPDTTIDRLPSEPIRIGYDFTGWKDENNVDFTAATTVTADITVYAQWDPYKCIVSFDKNGGDTEASPPTKTVTYPATTVDALPTTSPTREGYNFIGWRDGSGAVFTENTPVGILYNKAITVYAQWAEKTYTISGTISKSDGGGASGATVELLLNGNRINMVTADAQGKYEFSNVLARDNYTIRASLTGYSSETTAPFNMPRDDVTGKDLTLQKLCSVTFNSDGGSPVPTQYINSGATATKPANPGKTGYTFDNWYDTSALSTVYDFGKPVTGDITLYAKWIAITYTVACKANGGSGLMPSQGFTYGIAQNLNANTFTRTGYAFVGWAESALGAKEYDNNQNVNNLRDTQGATVTLFAVWSPITYTVVFNANGGSGLMPSQGFTYGIAQNLNVNTFTRAGYAFVGWKDNENDTSYTNGQNVINLRDTQGATVTLYAQWMPAYNVTFDKNNTDVDSTEADPQIKPVISPKTTVESLPTPPKRIGYTFNGWKDENNVDFTATTTVTADITVYAQWTANTYTINYRDVGNGPFSGTHGADHPTSHTYGMATTLVDPAKANYTFGGWFEDSDGLETRLTSLSATGSTGTITLYAKWIGDTYTITYLDLGGGPFSGTTGPGPTSHTYGTATTLFSPTKPGHAFDGWFNEFGTVLTTLSATGYTANITLYAKWVANTYPIIYQDAGGGSFSGTHGYDHPTSHTYGTVTNLVNPVEPNGLTFVGWFYNDTGSALTILSATGYTDTITLYARWTGDSYPIIYWDDYDVPFSGTHRSGAPTSHTYGTVTTLVSPVEPSGKTFEGWFYNNGGSALTSLSATGYTSEINLYARWGDVSYTITYDINGGTGTPPSTQPVNYGGSFTTHSGSGLSKPGYTFSGWNTDEFGTGTDYAANTSYYPTSNLYLYAKWAPISYTVVFDANGGSGTAMANQPFTYGVSQSLSTNTYIRTGYTFAGWAISESGGVAYTDGQDGSTLTTENGATVTLFAKWNVVAVITVTGDIKLNGGSGSVSDIVVQLYRYNEGTQKLEPVGKAENPTESDQYHGTYTVTGDLTAGYIYFITASLAGYETKVVPVDIPGGTVSLELDFIGARRSVPQSIEQMIMGLMQGGFRN
jgi:uncharacterized repeat protein (TIGR02543 family)